MASAAAHSPLSPLKPRSILKQYQQPHSDYERRSENKENVDSANRTALPFVGLYGQPNIPVITIRDNPIVKLLAGLSFEAPDNALFMKLVQHVSSSNVLDVTFKNLFSALNDFPKLKEALASLLNDVGQPGPVHRHGLYPALKEAARGLTRNRVHQLLLELTHESKIKPKQFNQLMRLYFEEDASPYVMQSLPAVPRRVPPIQQLQELMAQKSLRPEHLDTLDDVLNFILYSGDAEVEEQNMKGKMAELMMKHPRRPAFLAGNLKAHLNASVKAWEPVLKDVFGIYDYQQELFVSGEERRVPFETLNTLYRNFSRLGVLDDWLKIVIESSQNEELLATAGNVRTYVQNVINAHIDLPKTIELHLRRHVDKASFPYPTISPSCFKVAEFVRKALGNGGVDLNKIKGMVSVLSVETDRPDGGRGTSYIIGFSGPQRSSEGLMEAFRQGSMELSLIPELLGDCYLAPSFVHDTGYETGTVVAITKGRKNELNVARHNGQTCGEGKVFEAYNQIFSGKIDQVRLSLVAYPLGKPESTSEYRLGYNRTPKKDKLGDSAQIMNPPRRPDAKHREPCQGCMHRALKATMSLRTTPKASFVSPSKNRDPRLDSPSNLQDKFDSPNTVDKRFSANLERIREKTSIKIGELIEEIGGLESELQMIKKTINTHAKAKSEIMQDKSLKKQEQIKAVKAYQKAYGKELKALTAKKLMLESRLAPLKDELTLYRWDLENNMKNRRTSGRKVSQPVFDSSDQDCDGDASDVEVMAEKQLVFD